MIDHGDRFDDEGGACGSLGGYWFGCGLEVNRVTLKKTPVLVKTTTVSSVGVAPPGIPL